MFFSQIDCVTPLFEIFNYFPEVDYQLLVNLHTMRLCPKESSSQFASDYQKECPADKLTSLFEFAPILIQCKFS